MSTADLTRRDLYLLVNLANRSLWLHDVDLAGADLASIELGSADLGSADLAGADLKGAKLQSAILKAPTSLMQIWMGPTSPVPT